MSDILTRKQLEEAEARERVTPRGPWKWKKCYEMGDGGVHWAIESPESAAEKRVIGIKGTLALDDYSPEEHWQQIPENRFIATVRTDAPLAYATLRRAVELLERLLHGTGCERPKTRTKIAECGDTEFPCYQECSDCPPCAARRFLEEFNK